MNGIEWRECVAIHAMARLSSRLFNLCTNLSFAPADAVLELIGCCDVCSERAGRVGMQFKTKMLPRPNCFGEHYRVDPKHVQQGNSMASKALAFAQFYSVPVSRNGFTLRNHANPRELIPMLLHSIILRRTMTDYARHTCPCAQRLGIRQVSCWTSRCLEARHGGDAAC